MSLQSEREACLRDIKSLQENLTRINEQINKTYKRGDYFLVDGCLSQIIICDYRECCLIGLEFANRWIKPIKVDNVCKITEAELKEMTCSRRIEPISKREALKIMECCL